MYDNFTEIVWLYKNVIQDLVFYLEFSNKTIL